MNIQINKPAGMAVLLALFWSVIQVKALDYVSTVTNTPNLLGFWQFDPVFRINSCVNGYTGTLHGNAQIGPPGSGCPLAADGPTQALLLDGTNSYLSTTLIGQITNQGTVLAWVYLTAQPSAAGHIFQVTSEAQTGNDFDLQIQTDNKTYFYTDSGSSTVYAGPLPLNQWQFLAVTFIANSTRCIYLNGQLVASSTAGSHSLDSSAFWMGNNSIFGPRMFQGRLDEVAVFNRALSASEITTIYSAAQTRPTTIDPNNHYSYGANFGWMDWRGDSNNGAVIGEYVCSGYIYSANVGWINLGGGSPTNGIYYQNLSSNDFGINQDGLGNLRGYAWGANIGWLNFENTGAPQVNLQTGILSGNVWSANCGWISLNNMFAYVQTDEIAPGFDSTGDGIPDAWSLLNFGTVNINPNATATNGMTVLNNYLAGTNPNNSNDVFAITAIGRGTFAPGYTTLQWNSKPSRDYVVQYKEALDYSTNWVDLADYGLGADMATFSTGNPNGQEFYRIRATRPLIP